MEHHEHNDPESAHEGAKHPHALLAIATYFVFFLPKFSPHKENAFIKYHERQAVALVVFALFMQGIISVLGYWGFPTVISVWPVRAILAWELYVAITNVLKGETRPLPIIGEKALKVYA